MNLRELDSQYKPFPSFTDWNSGVKLDLTRWDRYSGELLLHREESAEQFAKATEIARRAAAVDTGAIEGLYDVDKGFTITVATQAAMWESAVAAKGSDTREIIESQLDSYDYVLDFATGTTPIAEAWIRELHSKLCGAQKTYQALTEVGIQQQKLQHGQYKSSPNHVRARDGTLHAYAPVDLTPSEMHRFCEELRTPQFQAAHPVLQASYAHYAFVAIHPFADGNGRVSRAMASVFTYRAASIPLLILAEHRDDYFASLMAADAGQYEAFIYFIMDRCLDAILLINECFDAANHSGIDEAIEKIDNLYITKAGFTHEQVDAAGYKFADSIKNAFTEASQPLAKTKHLNVTIQMNANKYLCPDKTMRLPLGGKGRHLTIHLTTNSPANASRQVSYQLYLPRDCDSTDDIQFSGNSDEFTARINELIPRLTTTLEWRIKAHAEKILRQMMSELSIAAAKQVGRDLP